MKKKILIFSLLLTLLLCCVFISCEDDDHEHKYVYKRYESTCTERGYTEGTCTICNGITREYYPELEHTYEWVNVEAGTCETPSKDQKKCTECGHVADERLGEVSSHQYLYSTVLPTCKEQGYDLTTCAVCGFFEKTNHTPITSNHTEGEWIVIKRATCKETGIQKKYCTVCEKELKSGIISLSTTHDFSTEVFPSDGVNSGYTVYKCNICEYQKTLNDSANLSPSIIYELISSAMVRIESYDRDNNRIAIGSGFFISGDGIFVTNYHVIRGASSIKVYNYAGREYTVSGIHGYNSFEDVAVGKVVSTSNPYLETVGTDTVKTGDPVYTLGSPLGLDNIFSSGIVSNSSIIINGNAMIAFTAPISSGNSGGPLVNAEGKVIGINTRTAVDGQNLNFAVMSERITETDTSTLTSISDIYERELQATAFNVLVNYIRVNATGSTDTADYIYKFIRESTQTSYGLEYYLQYNSSLSQVELILNLISGKATRFEVKLVISSISKTYKLYLFDYNMGQTTIEATIKADITATLNNMDEVMTVELMKYVNTEAYPTQVSHNTTLTYQGYLQALKSFDEIIDASNTGLDLGHFNLMTPDTTK